MRGVGALTERAIFTLVVHSTDYVEVIDNSFLFHMFDCLFGTMSKSAVPDIKRCRQCCCLAAGWYQLQDIHVILQISS